MRVLSSFIGRAKLCALGRRLCPVCSLSWKWCQRTWHGLELIDLNSPRSASRTNSSNDSESTEWTSPLLSPSRRLSWLLCGGKSPPCRRGIYMLQGGDGGRSGNQLQLLRTKAVRPKSSSGKL